MIKFFYGGLIETSIPFSNLDNLDIILDLLDDYCELVENIEEVNDSTRTDRRIEKISNE